MTNLKPTLMVTMSRECDNLVSNDGVITGGTLTKAFAYACEAIDLHL